MPGGGGTGLSGVCAAVGQCSLPSRSPEDVQALVSGKLALRYAGRQVGALLCSVLLHGCARHCCAPNPRPPRVQLGPLRPTAAEPRG